LSAAVKAPQFKMSFFAPRYWPVWLGATLLYLLTWLPFPLIRLLGRGVGYLLKTLAKQRVWVARRNIELWDPSLSSQQVDKLLNDNIARTGMALFETAMGWWWPNWRVKRHFEVEGYEYVEEAFKAKGGVFGMALHNVNLEFACRGLGYTHPSIAFYRKHDNPLIDYLQYHGRNRSNKYMIHKRNSKALIRALEDNEMCLYLPDQDYGPRQSIFVPFGGVSETATTTGTLMFIRRTQCVPLMVTSQYTASGYKVKFYPPMPELRDMDDETALTLLNQKIDTIVKEQPDSYLWMHKRFKTRPESSPQSLYK